MMRGIHIVLALLMMSFLSFAQRDAPGSVNAKSDAVSSLNRKVDAREDLSAFGLSPKQAYELNIINRKLDKSIASNDTRNIQRAYLDKWNILMPIVASKDLSGTGSSLHPVINHLKAVMINVVSKEKAVPVQVDMYMMLADALGPYNENFEEAKKYYLKALDLCRGMKEDSNKIIIQFKIGELHMSVGDITSSERYLQESLRTAREQKNLKWEQKASSFLGLVYAHLGEYSKGLKYGIAAEHIALERKDKSEEMIYLYNNLGINYEATRNLKTAYLYYKKAMELNEKYGYDILTVNIVANAAKILITYDPRDGIAFMDRFLKHHVMDDKHDDYGNVYGKYVMAYTLLQEYEKGQPYCDKLIVMSENSPALSGDQVLLLTPVIHFLIASGQYPLAKKYLVKYHAVANANKILPIIENAHMLSAMVDSATGDFKNAFLHYKQYKIWSDSLLGITSTKEISRLGVEYETERKNRDIKLLEQQSLLQRNKLQTASLIRNVSIAGVLLLIVVVALVVNQNRIKKRSNQIISRKNEKLEQLVDEKEWLLKEVHHRVKNNLQTVVSLLGAQSSFLKDDALKAIQDSQNRIQAMALIHQKLYAADGIGAIKMRPYLEELISYLKASFQFGKEVHFNIDIDSMELDISQAIPIGLIINEAVTNTLKYAFINAEDNNEINITMNSSEETIKLTIADNGQGFKSSATSFKPGMGLALMEGLSGDLEGTFQVAAENGTRINIRFPKA